MTALSQLKAICLTYEILNEFLEERYNEVFGGSIGITGKGLVVALTEEGGESNSDVEDSQSMEELQMSTTRVEDLSSASSLPDPLDPCLRDEEASTTR